MDSSSPVIIEQQKHAATCYRQLWLPGIQELVSLRSLPSVHVCCGNLKQGSHTIATVTGHLACQGVVRALDWHLAVLWLWIKREGPAPVLYQISL